jgi:predicted phosphodiesterase
MSHAIAWDDDIKTLVMLINVGECVFTPRRISMRLVVISDTHGLHNHIGILPAGDVLVHAGDFMNSGLYPEEILSFNHWLAKQAIQRRVVCGGNHDRLFQLAPRLARELLTNATYLENTGVTIDGVSFWASPYTPEFLNWAFMYPRGAATRYWELLKAVEEIKPKLHIFGHIHGGAGTFDNGTTRFVNAAYLNEQYRPEKPAGMIRIVDL